MNKQNKTVITKESLINLILDKCSEDYISTDDLYILLDKATDEYGNIFKKKLIKSIRDSHTKNTIKDIYNLFENCIFESLSLTNKKHDICIKLFEGVNLDGKFIQEEIKTNNLTGETITVASHIKPKFNITRTYREKLNNK